MSLGPQCCPGLGDSGNMRYRHNFVSKWPMFVTRNMIWMIVVTQRGGFKNFIKYSRAGNPRLC